MPFPGTYDMSEPHYRGDVWEGITFKLYTIIDEEQIPDDLTGFTAKMQLRKDADTPVLREWSTGDGTIEIVDNEIIIQKTSGNKMKIDEGLYRFDVEIKNVDNEPITHIKGSWEFYNDITHE